MRFGGFRAQAPAGALGRTPGAAAGITSKSPRALMTGLPGTPYPITQASCDLARLARNGLITRRPHASTYDPTPGGLAFAVFCTKTHDRALAPCPPPATPRPHPRSAPPSAPSNTTPASASPTSGCCGQPDKLSWSGSSWHATGLERIIAGDSLHRVRSPALSAPRPILKRAIAACPLPRHSGVTPGQDDSFVEVVDPKDR